MRHATPAALAAFGLAVVGCASPTLTPDARPGDTLTQEVREPESPVAHDVRNIEAGAPAGPVADAAPVDESDESILTGVWRQVEIECSGPQPSEVQELEFGEPARFSITFLPFESYRDYWGQVDFDPVAGHLVLTVEGGNNEPENPILSGPARLEADGRRLVLESFNLGSSGYYNSGWPCRYVFAR